MKVVFSNHAKNDKFPILEKHSFHLTEKDILEVINNPDHEDTESDKPRIIASKNIDNKHILRIVYKIDGGILKVITFYPAEKGRYYK